MSFVRRNVLVGAIVAGLAAALAGAAQTPAEGSKAPDFTLATIDGTKITLSTELARGPAVLIVGRGWVG